MSQKTVRLSTVAVFLFAILLSMLLSRMEESRKAAAIGTKQSVPVLMYHHLLSEKDGSKYNANDIVTFAEDFERQLGWLKENGYQSISPAQLVAWFYDGAAIPEKAVMLTFDDGYMSNFIYGYPLLKQYGFSAVIFSVTGKIAEQTVNFNPNQINMLDAASMQAGSDVFYYASHTHNLHTLHGKHSALVDADAALVQQDLKESFAALQAFSSADVTVFSYPYGNYSDAVIDLLKQNGVQLAFRADKGTLTRDSNPYALPRFPVSHKISFETFKSYFR